MDIAQSLDTNGDGSGSTFDPLTGTPNYYTDSPLVSGPQTGDSGVSYSQQILDLLKFGVSTVAKNQQQAYDSKLRYEAGRQGLTVTGQPVNAVQVGGVTVSKTALVFMGIGALALLYFHGR